MKILLIEDRPERQELFMKDTQINLDLYGDILDNMIDDKYQTLFEELKSDAFDFSQYSIIISHKSAFDNYNTSMIHKLEQYCKEHKKPLVLFSGGISASYYDNSEYEYMELNSKVFYSQNLQLFLDDFRKGGLHPLILNYGNQWKLNILLNVLEKVNNFLEENEKESIFYKRFVEKSNIDLIETVGIELDKPDLQGKRVHKDEIKKISDNILDKIKKSVIYE